MAIEERIEKNVILAPFTSFKIGGPAKFFVEANTQTELIEAIEWAVSKGEKYFVLGGGSNIIVADSGFDGLVIKNDCRLIEWQKEAVVVESGTPLSLLVDQAKRHSLSGLEWAAGLPGTVGGAIRGNAGCFGGEIGQLVTALTIYDESTGQVRQLKPEEAGFAYRTSVFKSKPWLVLAVSLRLKAGLEGDIVSMMSKNVRYRIDHQPAYPSPGSIFKNVSFEDVKSSNVDLAVLAENENIVPSSKDGLVGAGWIIEKAHLKGKMMGGAMVSLEHANFIINKTQEARAEDVVMLISFIKQQVRLIYNIHLVEEIKYVGF